MADGFRNIIPGYIQLISIIFLITSISVAFVIISEKRSPYKTIAWILVLVLIPIVGLVFYIFFGQEYRKRKIFSRKGLKRLGKRRSLAVKQLKRINEDQLELSNDINEKEKIISLLLNNSDSVLTLSNRIKILNNGKTTFKEIFSAIENAKHHIHLEYYIIEDDSIGNQLKDILIRKSKEGVQVRIIYDDVGSWNLSKKYIDHLKDSGVEIFPFMKVRFPRLTSKLNYRNHRKILIVDGEIGFTGGINFADRYIHGIKKIGYWRDTHLKIEGEAVSYLQVVFAVDWFFVKGENLKGIGFYKSFSDFKGIPIQIAASGPDSDWEGIGQAFFAAISSAKEKVYITTPYLIPPQHILAAMKTAALGKIDVRIIIPEKSDTRISKWCSFSFITELLEAGVKVYFYQKGIIHSKILIVDSILSSIGTTNLDFRSIETNFEVNAFIYDKEINKLLIGNFTEDLKNSREIKLEKWRKRKWQNKLRESLAHIVSPML